jgi:6-phosphogluconolactonase
MQPMSSFSLALCAALALVSLACSKLGAEARARAATPATHLFVSTHDGRVRAVAVADGQIGTAVAEVELGEAARFLAFHPTLPVLYALGDSQLFAFTWDQSAATLTPLGKGAVGGRGTHVAVHTTGKCAIVASYGENSVSLLPLAADGKPENVAQTIGKGDDGGFRRAHQVHVHAPTGTVHVPCLGEDHVAVLRLADDGRSLNLIGTARTPAGAGPRHMDYSPEAPHAYALNEVGSSITHFRIEPATGALGPEASVTTLPLGFAEKTSRSSDIHVAPGGKFLFAVNREPLDDIVSFAIASDGRLREVARIATGGLHARTFAVDPSGSHVWLANTKSKDLTAFVARSDGSLARLGEAWAAGAEPSCVLAR